MSMRSLPPRRGSHASTLLVKPCGPHHCARWAGSVQACQTSARGALTSRVMCSGGRTAADSLLADSLLPADMLLLLGLQLLQVGIEALEARLPEGAVAFDPVGGALQRTRAQAARPALRIAPALDEAGARAHLELLAGRRHPHGQRFVAVGL